MKKLKMMPLIIIIIFLLIIIVLYFITKKDTNEKLNIYLTKNGFNETDNAYILSKQISGLSMEDFENNVLNNINSEYSSLLFNTYTHILYKDYRIYRDNILINFLPKYDYNLNKLSYSYNVTSDNSNIIFAGDYNNDNFTCNITFSSEENVSAIKNDICDSIKFKVDDFKYEAVELINSAKLLNEMKSRD